MKLIINEQAFSIKKKKSEQNNKVQSNQITRRQVTYSHQFTSKFITK